MRKGRELNCITTCFAPLIDATLILTTLLAQGKTIKALRHLPWAVMFLCPRWLVWCTDLSPHSRAAQAQWGILWLLLLLETEVLANWFQAGYVFPLRLDFKGSHPAFEALWHGGNCSCREVGAGLKCRARCSCSSPAVCTSLQGAACSQEAPSELPSFCYTVGLESWICSVLGGRFDDSAGILL